MRRGAGFFSFALEGGRGYRRWSRVSAGLLLLTLARVQCWLNFFITISQVFSFALGRGGQPSGERGSAIGVDAGLLLRTLARVKCWQYFLSLLATVRGGTSFLCPTATKKRSKENASPQSVLSVPSVQTTAFGSRVARCSLEPRTLEPLLLANSYIPTLRHQCSRARSVRPQIRPVPPCPRFTEVCLRPPYQAADAPATRASVRSNFRRRCSRLARGVPLFLGVLMLSVLRAMHAPRLNCVGGSSSPPTRKTREAELVRRTRNLPESTGGEAWGCQDSREGGFQMSVVLRAPFYVGTKSSGLHAGDT